MKPINYKNIRRSTIAFWIYFFFLAVCAFIPFWLFFKSYQVQNEFIAVDINTCKQIVNKQIEVHNKVDSLYSLMDMLNSNKVTNDIFLEKYIVDKKNDIIKTIDADSIDFRHCNSLLNGIDRMLLLKDSIRTISENERMALKDLTDCIGNIRKVQKGLTYDPARNFTIAK